MKTKIFLSWSGAISKSLAGIFADWLELVLPFTAPFFSHDDIAKGTHWNAELLKELESSGIGLLFLTKDNLSAPWLMFEAGILLRNRSNIVPILFDLTPDQVLGPLNQFQTAVYDEKEIKKTIEIINAKAGELAFGEIKLNKIFERWWPQLKKEVDQVLQREKLEVVFREMPIEEQIFMFLDGIARQRKWTFYEPRGGEVAVNGALIHMVKGLLTEEKEHKKAKAIRDNFYKYIKKWLHSNNDSAIYFASEIIGYFKDGFAIFELDLTCNYDSGNTGIWKYSELNCLWAHARLTSYEAMNKLLLETRDENTQTWILEAYKQMILNKDNSAGDDPSLFLETIEKVEPISDQNAKIIKEIMAMSLVPLASYAAEPCE